MKILAMCGSLRRDSYNRIVLDNVEKLLPEGVELEVYEGLEELPAYNEDIDVHPRPEPVERLRAAISDADGLLIATPEYNGSIPGQLKNAIDWASRPFPDNCLRFTPAAVVGASRSPFGAVSAQAELRKVLGICGARVVDREVPIGRADEQFDADGRLLDDDICRQLAVVSDELLAAAEQRDGAAACAGDRGRARAHAA